MPLKLDFMSSTKFVGIGAEKTKIQHALFTPVYAPF